MIRLLTVCDPHLSAHNPAAWKAPYEEVMATALEELVKFAEVTETRAILVAGDFFHLKAASRNPLGFLVRVSRILQRMPCPVYGIAGNHDLRTGSIWNGGLEGQPLEILTETGAVILLDDRPVQLLDPTDGTGCWIQGTSFNHGSADTFVGLARQNDEHVHVHLGHFGFSPEGSGQLYGEEVFGPEDLGAAFDVAVIGHHHWDQGVQQIDGRWYMAHGSFGWTSCHKADRDRVPQIGVIEVHPLGKTVTAMALPLRYPQAFEELIDVEKRDMIQEEAEQLEEFTVQLGERLLEAPAPEAVLEDLELEADVRDRARTYLEEAENG